MLLRGGQTVVWPNRTSAAKAVVHISRLRRGLKPRPFKTKSSKPLIIQGGLSQRFQRCATQNQGCPTVKPCPDTDRLSRGLVMPCRALLGSPDEGVRGYVILTRSLLWLPGGRFLFLRPCRLRSCSCLLGRCLRRCPSLIRPGALCLGLRGQWLCAWLDGRLQL
jgi:hypothetical protein